MNHWGRFVLIALAFAAPAAAARGDEPTAKPRPVDSAALYLQRCAVCHGKKGDSPMPSQNFTDSEWKRGSSLKQVAEVVRNGVPGTPMTAFKTILSEGEIDALARYVRQFDPVLKAANTP